MGNACSCISKNKEPKEACENETIKKEEKPNDVKEEPKEVNEEIKKEDIKVVESEKKPVLELYAEAPEDFKFEPVENVGKDVIPEENEFPDSENDDTPEKNLDDVAIELGKHNFPSFNSLIYHLIHKRSDNHECDDLDKVRAVFTWLTTKNLHDLKSIADELPEESPESVLLGITTGKTAYAQLFQMLCRYAGLQCKLIRGYAKGVDYKPGMKLGGGKEAQHAWNAVKVNGKWCLFDCHWAARRLMGKSVNTDRLKYDLDMFYFMTNPVQLRYTHFPFEDDWQLVKKKITLEEFENLTLIKPTFFKYGLKLHSHTEAIIDVHEKLVLKLKIPIDLIDKICLTFTLTLDGLGEIYEGSNLTRYGMQETNKSTGICTLSFRFPKSGSYKLLLYARECGDQVFGGICEYKIVCKLPQVEYVDDSGEKHTKEQKVKPYPPTQQPSYGHTEMSTQYNLECLERDTSTIHITDGEFEIGFQRKSLAAGTGDNNSSSTFPRLMARLKSSFHDDTKLIGRILQRNTYNGNEIDKFIVTVFLPDAGEYALEIYANNPDVEGTSFFLVWQFFVCTEKGTELPKGMPEINPGAAIGAQTQFEEFNLKCISHTDPYIIVPIKPLKLEDNPELSDLIIQIGMPPKNTIKVLSQLVDVSSLDEEKECSDYVLQQSILGDETTSEVCEVKFNVRLPKGGCSYKLHIYAAPSNNETETLPMVFTYLINAPLRLGSSDTPYNGSTQGTYPYQLSQWKEKCRLYEPLNRKICTSADPDEQNVHFKFQIPEAHHVAVVLAGETWIQLSREDDTKPIWNGDVKIDESSIINGSKVAICACYTSTITSYNTMLEYFTCSSDKQ